MSALSQSTVCTPARCKACAAFRAPYFRQTTATRSRPGFFSWMISAILSMTWIGGSAAMGEPSPAALESLAAAAIGSADRRGVEQEIGRFLGALSPLQRTVMAGFPPLGSDYWDAQTIRGTHERYGGHVALEPYAAAMRTGKL